MQPILNHIHGNQMKSETTNFCINTDRRDSTYLLLTHVVHDLDPNHALWVDTFACASHTGSHFICLQ